MPTRMINGEGLWKSDKIAQLPPKFKAEYANLLPLSLANGVFECSAHRVWSTVYAFNRPEVTAKTVQSILQSFEDVGLLFRWNDGAKQWAYFTGSDKRGRLPPPSERGRYECGPEPPEEQLKEYLHRFGNSHSVAPTRIAVKTAPERFAKPRSNGPGLLERTKAQLEAE